MVLDGYMPEQGRSDWVRVRGCNSNGCGGWSAKQITQAVGRSLGSMEPPGMIAGKRPTVPAGKGSIEVEWEAPGRTGGVDASALTYDVRYGTGERSQRPAWSIVSAGSGSSYTLTGLTADTEYQVQVRAVNDAGAGPWSYVVRATPQATAKAVAAIAAFALEPNVPNPFNPTTTIHYALSHAVDVQLTVYNIAGQAVRTLVAAYQSTGRYAVEWDATDERGRHASAGLYFYRLQAGGEFHAVEKMLLLK